MGGVTTKESPLPPSYLGTVHKTTCGYKYDHCMTGTMFYARYIAEAMGVNLKSETYKGNLVKKYNGLTTETCQTWLDTLVPTTEKRPSNSHFKGVIRNLDGYECKLDLVPYPNPRVPTVLVGYWFVRWPTEREAASLLLRSSEVFFGIPPKPHCHGN